MKDKERFISNEQQIKDYGFGTIQQDQQPFYQQGWVCPKCGGVMSPYQYYCINCQPKCVHVTSTGIIPTTSTENKSISKGERYDN